MPFTLTRPPWTRERVDASVLDARDEVLLLVGAGSGRGRLHIAAQARAWINACPMVLVAPVLIVFMFAAGLVGARFVPAVHGWGSGVPPTLVTAPAEVENVFVRYDSGYYLGIAIQGYSFNSPKLAFFPGYPLLTRVVSSASGLSLSWSGLTISVLCLLLAGYFLYRLIRTDLPSLSADLSTLALFMFPLSFFLVGFYAESLFLFLSVLTVYLARKGRFVLGGLVLSLAGLVRPLAPLLAVPFIIEFLLQRDFSAKRVASFALGICLAPIGMGFYMAFVAQTSDAGYIGNWGAQWSEHTDWPWITLADGLKAAVYADQPNSDWFGRVVVWHDLLYLIFGGALAVWAVRQMRPSLSVMLIVGIVMLLFAHGPEGYPLLSLSRRLAALFPLYVALGLFLAQVGPGRRMFAIAASTAQLALLAAWFGSGRWVA